jgi:hypothetical protein
MVRQPGVSELERLLDELCQDSLEVPLSHVDNLPDDEYEISHRFKLVRDGIRELEAALREIHEYNCGCDQPGRHDVCVAQPVVSFAILQREERDE